jgi:hypothetical protein
MSDPSAHTTILEVDFGSSPEGRYDEAAVRRDFGAPLHTNGLAEGRVERIGGEPRAIRVHYPQGAVGPRAGGAQWLCALPRGAEALSLAYSLRFGEDFDFVLGGKLPGLAGGSANTGGTKPNGRDGFSARMMWREHGRVVQYLYHPDQPGTWGEDFAWKAERERRFVPGRWHRVEHEICLNHPGERDGSIAGYFDGELALFVGGLRFRELPALTIDHFYFSTFFGGNEAAWAPTRDEHIDFADFVIGDSRA